MKGLKQKTDITYALVLIIMVLIICNVYLGCTNIKIDKLNLQLAKPLADDYCKLQTYSLFTGTEIEIKECWECNSCIPIYVQQLIDSQINMSRKVWEIKRIDNKECLIYPTQIVEKTNYTSSILFTNQTFSCVDKSLNDCFYKCLDIAKENGYQESGWKRITPSELCREQCLNPSSPFSFDVLTER